VIIRVIVFIHVRLKVVVKMQHCPIEQVIVISSLSAVLFRHSTKFIASEQCILFLCFVTQCSSLRCFFVFLKLFKVGCFVVCYTYYGSFATLSCSMPLCSVHHHTVIQVSRVLCRCLFSSVVPQMMKQEIQNHFSIYHKTLVKYGPISIPSVWLEARSSISQKQILVSELSVTCSELITNLLGHVTQPGLIFVCMSRQGQFVTIGIDHRRLKLRTDGGYARVRELGSIGLFCCNFFESEPIATKF